MERPCVCYYSVRYGIVRGIVYVCVYVCCIISKKREFTHSLTPLTPLSLSSSLLSLSPIPSPLSLLSHPLLHTLHTEPEPTVTRGLSSIKYHASHRDRSRYDVLSRQCLSARQGKQLISIYYTARTVFNTRAHLTPCDHSKIEFKLTFVYIPLLVFLSSLISRTLCPFIGSEVTLLSFIA